MGKIISITNQKGGVGKTTSAINLSAALAESNQKILVVDFDPQTNATSGFGVELGDDDKTIMDVLQNNSNIEESIITQVLPNLDLLAGDIVLSSLEADSYNEPEREKKLKKILDPIKEQYDYIIIDCPPSVGMLTINALVASDSAIIPVQCEYFSLEGLSQVMDVIDLVRQRMNTSLKIEGILFTMYDGRTKLAQDVVKEVKNLLNEHIFNTLIPRNVRLAEAPSNGMTIFSYDSASSGAESYRKLAAEILEQNM